MVDVCGYELPTNLQNFTQKHLTEVKIFQNVFRGGVTFFLKHRVRPCLSTASRAHLCSVVIKVTDVLRS